MAKGFHKHPVEHRENAIKGALKQSESMPSWTRMPVKLEEEKKPETYISKGGYPTQYVRPKGRDTTLTKFIMKHRADIDYIIKKNILSGSVTRIDDDERRKYIEHDPSLRAWALQEGVEF